MVEAGVVVDTVIRWNWWWATNFLMSVVNWTYLIGYPVAKIRFCNTYLYNENWF